MRAASPVASSARVLEEADAGAHIGTHSVPYAHHTAGTVYSFEPQQVMYELLRDNLLRNNCMNAKPIQAVVGHRIGQVQLADTTTDGPNPGAPLRYDDALERNYGGLQLGENGEEVAQVCLDALELGDAGFIKVAAEGAEPLLLFGARALVDRWHPLILFEQNHKRITGAMIRGQQLPVEAYSTDWALVDLSRAFYFQAHQVEFCGGAVVVGDELLHSYGVGACRAYLTVLSAVDVERLFR